MTTKLPAIPEPPRDLPPQLAAWARAMKEAVEVRAGQRGDPLDRAVTVRELYEAGAINLVNTQGQRQVFEGTPEDSSLTAPEAPASSGTITLGTPETPTGITSYGTARFAVIAWDSAGYLGHAYTELYQSATNDLGTATLHSTWDGDSAAVDLGGAGVTRYYWVRFVNTNGDQGAFHAGTTSGEAVTTSTDPSTALMVADKAVMVMALIQSAQIADAAITNAKIANATIEGGKIAASTITATNYNELRNSQIVNGEDSVDASYPIIVRFPILSEMTAIEAVRLSFAIEPFRAYSQAGSASAGGESLTTATSSASIPTHSHNLQVFVDASTTNQAAVQKFVATGVVGLAFTSGQTWTSTTVEGHSHSLSIPSVGGGSTVYFDSSSGRLYCSGGGTLSLPTASGHSHEIEILDGTTGVALYWDTSANRFEVRSGSGGNVASDLVEVPHDHGLNTSNHTHSVNFGIYEEDNTGSASVTVRASNNNGSTYALVGTGYTTNQLELDLAGHFSSSGWKAIKFECNVRARIVWTLELKLDISA